jgi:hypothetical protein
MGSCCSSSKGQRLGGDDADQITNGQPKKQNQMADREAMLQAAEQRQKDMQGKGILAKKLKEQNSIGPGRANGSGGGNNSEATLKVLIQ